MLWVSGVVAGRLHLEVLVVDGLRSRDCRLPRSGDAGFSQAVGSLGGYVGSRGS